MPLKAVSDPALPVSTVQMMRFAVAHDLSYPDVIAFVRRHARLPHDLAEFHAFGWRGGAVRGTSISA